MVEVLKTDLTLFVYSAILSVDCFFWIGGFFMTYVILDSKKISKINFYPKNLINLLFTMLHRFLRLWPCLIVCLLIFWKISPYFGSGPFWEAYIRSLDVCDKAWWQRLLFIRNLTNTGEDQYDCFVVAWYLDNDV